jgi:hypothetical protein
MKSASIRQPHWHRRLDEKRPTRLRAGIGSFSRSLASTGFYISSRIRQCGGGGDRGRMTLEECQPSPGVPCPVAECFPFIWPYNAHSADVPAAMTLKPWVVPVKAD